MVRKMHLTVGVLALLGVAGCPSVETYDRPGGIAIYDAGASAVLDGGIRPSVPVLKGEVNPVRGFVSDKLWNEYYYLGEVKLQGGRVPVNRMYFFFDEDDRPLFRLSSDQDASKRTLVGWHPVIDVVPTRAGYSPFWTVVKVRVRGKADHAAIDALRKRPAQKDVCQMDANCAGDKVCIEQRCTDPIEVGVFPLDGIKSLETLRESKLATYPTSTLLNCPVVDADATLVKGLTHPDVPYPKVQLWYQRLKAFCFLVQGGAELLGAGPAGPTPEMLGAEPQDAYFIRQSLDYVGKTCGDGKCDTAGGEDCITCEKDCKSCCGNKSCDKHLGEDCTSCATDCGPCQAGGPCPTCCGDGKCDPSRAENCVSCQADCGTCTAFGRLVLAARTLVVTEKMPGDAGYTPLHREHTVLVDGEHAFSDVTSVADIRKNKLHTHYTGKVHNMVVRGGIPKCNTDADCAGTGGSVDPPLKCSVELGYCAPPFARLYEDCRREVKECDPKGGPGGSRLVCVGLRVRERYFCFNACDSDKKDENPDNDIDTRCGSVKGYRCYALSRSSPNRANGVCIRICNSRAGGQDALLKECVSPTCQNGKLEVGETCDDGNAKNQDGCNQFCTLSTFDRCETGSDCKGQSQKCEPPVFGQKATYCLPVTQKEKDETVENNKYRPICMEYNYCWPPDERADWLGKKEEVSQ